MKTLAYCVFVLLLLNPIVVFCALLIGHSYLTPDISFAIVASGAMALAWSAFWMAIRKSNARLDYECRKRMGWL